VHRAYVEAGSDAVHTCTFGATPIRLAGYGLAPRCGEINRIAVDIARRAGVRFVLGDVGPSGEYLPPVGKADAGAWHDAFCEQGRALADAGVDGFHVETMSDLREAQVALRALREVAPTLPVMVSLTFDRKKRGFFTVMGNPAAQTLSELAAEGAAAVGANCSITSGDMCDLAAEVASKTGPSATALVFQPNAGQPRPTAAGIVYDQTPAEFADDAWTMVTAGARLIGGCCGTDPGFVAALRRRVDGGAP